MKSTLFPTLKQLRENYHNTKFASDEHWIMEAMTTTYDDAEYFLRVGRWSEDRFEAFCMVWARGKSSGFALGWEGHVPSSEAVQHLADFLAAVLETREPIKPVTVWPGFRPGII